MDAGLVERARAMRDDLVEVRRRIHRYPETAFEERRTTALIVERLGALGLEVVTPVNRTGALGILDVRKSKGTIALRADIDALPANEENDHAFASEVPGKAHLCGHDAHTAALLGAARLLVEAKDRLRWRVKLLFQPSEERPPGGAPGILQAGHLEDVDEIYGLHNQPSLEVGAAALRPGPLMAAADKFRAVIQGHGGHAATPHLCVDPVPLLAQWVVGLQSIVARRVNPFEAAVVSTCVLRAGETFNVLPDEAAAEGTVRALEPITRDRVEVWLKASLRGVAEPAGAGWAFEYERGYPPVVNHRDQAEHAATTLRGLLGRDAVEYPCEPKMYGEDFAYYLERIAGAFFFLGSGNPERGTDRPLHSSRFDLDEDFLPLGAAAYAAIALER